MIIRTEALILRGMDYGETSRIVTLFTRDQGKLTVIAKGARRPKSRFGSTLQPLSYVQAIFYYKPTRSLQTLTECTHVQVFHTIGRDLERLTLGLRIVELLNALLQDEEAVPLLFALTLDTFHNLDTAPERVANLLPYFQLRMAGILGFQPTVEREEVEALPEAGGVLVLDSGAVRPSEAAPSTVRRASRSALRAFAVFALADPATVLRLDLPPATRREVERLVEAFLRHHVEDAYPTRGEAVISQLNTPGDGLSPPAR
jgi:DNA repair protein RecO (recombination protein O)